MTPEGKVKQDIKTVLKALNIWFYMPVQNGMGTVGIPDFIACHKGQFLAIETKAPGKKSQVTANQKNCLEAIERNGGWAVVVDNKQDFEVFLATKILEKHHGKIHP